ncbi:MAG: PRC-barrel domain-containing protein, partial [Selenomonadaceae bacterium]|nr:PRC-barrel domain-containing protein [Selenomonadaceae bacterium]
MKKSVEILGLPIISITEGRELGLSKSLLIDAKNGVVAAITIEDEDWYRGIKLIPYESIIALGEDAVTITHSENILNLDEAGDYERLLVENIRVIGTKAITKSGRIQGIVSEVFIGKGGKIEQCEITASDGSVSSVTADQISIFGKQVTVVNLDDEKKNSLIQEPPAFEPAYTSFHEEIPADIAEPVAEVEIPAEITEPVAEVEIPA